MASVTSSNTEQQALMRYWTLVFVKCVCPTDSAFSVNVEAVERQFVNCTAIGFLTTAAHRPDNINALACDGQAADNVPNRHTVVHGEVDDRRYAEAETEECLK
jgi:hypothetical protein